MKKHAGNPILQQDPTIGMYSTGHGSLAFSPDRSEMYYVHHGRPTPDADQRRLYTERMTLQAGVLDIDPSTSDRPVPSGVAPYAMRSSTKSSRLRVGMTAQLDWGWRAPKERAWRSRTRSTAWLRESPTAGRRGAPVRGRCRRHGGREAAGHTRITLTYQREHAAGGYFDVFNRARPVSRTVNVRVTGG